MNSTKLITTTLLLTLLVLLSACATFALEATATLVPTSAPTNVPTEAPTATQTQTPIPSATNTPAPTQTATPNISPTPIGEWRGLAIFPGAYDIDDEEDTLSFNIDASIQEVYAYYKIEFANAGWSLMAEGASTSDNILTFYSNGGQILTIGI